jgi:hypothetical protein
VTNLDEKPDPLEERLRCFHYVKFVRPSATMHPCMWRALGVLPIRGSSSTICAEGYSLTIACEQLCKQAEAAGFEFPVVR